MLAPEIKVPEFFEEELREYILLHYQDDPSKFSVAIHELKEMSLHMMKWNADVESVYSQILLTKKRFPLKEGEPLAVPFSWWVTPYILLPWL